MDTANQIENDRKSEQDEAQLRAKIARIAEKHEMSLDNDTEALIMYIAKGGFVNGIEKAITKDWALNMAIRFWQSPECRKRASTVQRVFEHICDLAGLMPQNKGSIAPILADLQFGGK